MHSTGEDLLRAQHMRCSTHALVRCRVTSSDAYSSCDKITSLASLTELECEAP